MKVCPQCGETYAEFVDFCFSDGTVLALEAAAPVPEEPDAFDAPPPPKMLQGSQQRASYTRSATPVPRARRPGRSLISGEAAYSPPREVESPAKRTPTPAPAPTAPQPEQMYGDAPEELEGAAPEEGALEGDVEQTWSDEEDEDGFFQPPTPPPAPQKAGQVSLSKADHQQWADEEEEEKTGGLGVFALAGAGFLAVAVVAVAALFAITTMMLPSDPSGTEPTEAPDPGPAPTPVQPQPVEPVEPAPVPEPVEWVPDATDAPEATDPVQPEPVEPQPAQPQPAEPAPAQPQPVTQPDPVASVTPRPQPEAAAVPVRFSSTPDGAMIYVDGSAIGTTSFLRQLSAGQHRVRIEKDGYQPFESVISVQPGMDGVNATLVPVGGVAPEPAPAPTPTPAPTAPTTPDPVPAPTPAPAAAAELLNTMFFMPGIEPNKAYVIYKGNKVGTSTGAKLSFPANGDKLTVEFRTPEGTTWTETANCAGPSPISSTTARLVITDACPGITGQAP